MNTSIFVSRALSTVEREPTRTNVLATPTHRTRNGTLNPYNVQTHTCNDIAMRRTERQVKYGKVILTTTTNTTRAYWEMFMMSTTPTPYWRRRPSWIPMTDSAGEQREVRFLAIVRLAQMASGLGGFFRVVDSTEPAAGCLGSCSS
jgi:hypothetical protein